MKNIRVFTDGAYSSSRNQGGIGIVFTEDNVELMHFSKGYKNTTNNQMEIRAIILALKSIKKPVESITIVTDSQYCIGTMTKGWKRKANQKLLAIYDKVYAETLKLCPKIEFEWVHGHQGNSFNEQADKLAVRASQEILTEVN